MPLALPFESDQASGPCDVLGTFIEEMVLKGGGLAAVAIETTALSRRQMAIAVLGKFPGAKVDS
ncbi:Uncharacterised protein [Mycobacteroides abscessus subsp. abscessus]|nr:Uncharacterised protein [Mycobacteroides abscessus subsp. abscessus]SLI09400.1 Uncharacterised protein [Mycobacteroides abscessus subsp. abscessus]